MARPTPTPPLHRAPDWTRAWFRTWLRLVPARERTAIGEDMEAAFATSLGEAVDAVAVGAWLRVWRVRPGISRPSPSTRGGMRAASDAFNIDRRPPSGSTHPAHRRHVAGRALRRAHARQRPRVRRDVARDAGHLHRRQRGHPERRAIRRPEAAAGAARRPHRDVPQRLPEGRRAHGFDGRAGLLRSTRADGRLRRAGALPSRGRDVRRQGRCPAYHEPARDAVLLPTGLGRAGARAHLY